MSNRNWYYISTEKQLGPISKGALIELIEIGEINRDTLVWNPRFEDWHKVGSINDFCSLFLPANHGPRNTNIQVQNSEFENTSIPSNYVVRHWRGELSLPVAWWVNGFLVNVLLIITDTAITELGTDTTRTGALLYIGFGVVIYVIYVWQVVGIWRSAGNYIKKFENAKDKSSRAWGRAAQVITIIGIIINVAITIPVLRDGFNLMQVADSNLFQRYYVQQVNETDVLLNGYINPNSVVELIEIFGQSEGQRSLILNSPGGILASAFELADYIRKNSIIVAARGECVSACLLILAAATVSAASADSSLIFHQPESIVKLSSPLVKAQLTLEEEEYYRRFAEYQIGSDYLTKYRKSNSNLIPLTLGEAYNAGFISLIWDTNTHTFHDPDDVCSLTDCFKNPVVLNNLETN